MWIEACDADDIEEEDVIRFDHGGRTFAIYRSPDDEYFATDGLCTHEQVHLADGLVMDNIIECPKHNGRFDYRTGEAKGAPVCVNLKTYPVKVEDGKVDLLDLRAPDAAPTTHAGRDGRRQRAAGAGRLSAWHASRNGDRRRRPGRRPGRADLARAGPRRAGACCSAQKPTHPTSGRRSPRAS